MFAIANVIFSQNLPSIYHSTALLHPTVASTTAALLHPTATLTTAALLHPTATSTTATPFSLYGNINHNRSASPYSHIDHSRLASPYGNIDHNRSASPYGNIDHSRLSFPLRPHRPQPLRFTLRSHRPQPPRFHPTATSTRAYHFAQQSRFNSSAENFSYFFKKALDKYPKTVYNVYCYLGVAQIGSALPWGGRGRRFKSCHSDQLKTA